MAVIEFLWNNRNILWILKFGIKQQLNVNAEIVEVFRVSLQTVAIAPSISAASLISSTWVDSVMTTSEIDFISIVSKVNLLEL